MRLIRNVVLILGAVFASCAVSSAQVSSDSLTVYFKVNRSDYDPSFRGNSQRMEEFIKNVRAVQQEPELMRILLVDFESGASPEGRFEINESLAHRRFDTIEKYLREHLDFVDSTLVKARTYEDWDGLRARLETLDFEWVDDVIRIIDTEDDLEARERRLRVLHDGRPWEYMLKNIYPDLRHFTVIVKTVFVLPEFEEPPVELKQDVPCLSRPTEAPASPAEPEWVRNLTLKTNLIGIGLGHANIAVEVDLAPHWSIAVPFYYSGGFDYFKPTLKFRGIVLQPEARFYLRGNDGFYLGAHFGLGWYNFALNSDWRIQDHKGNRPSWGGGLGLGYSLQFKKNPRWGMEFAVGGGVYDSLYDVFYNEVNGPYHKTAVRKTWFGVDNASVAFTYKFDLKKKGGDR